MGAFFIRDFLNAGALATAFLLVWLTARSPRIALLLRFLDRSAHRLARRKGTACLFCGVVLLLTRVLLLPAWPKPVPQVYDEFSYLLMADTFSLGRVANPAPPAWQHFETPFVQFQPTYQSVYPVTQGLVLALGLRAFGHPWWGVWLEMGVLAAVLCWMLQGWLPPLWALSGTLLAMAQFGVATYWMNSYWGGAPAAIGGALVLGAWPRLERGVPSRVAAAAMACGILVLANSRPWEGFLLAGTAGILLAWRLRRRLPPWRVVWPAAGILAAGAAATMYYFWRVTGIPWRMPYQVAFEQYAATGMFFWSPFRHPHYNHPQLAAFYTDMAVLGRAPYATLGGMLHMAATKLYVIGGFYLGPALLVTLIALPWAFRSRRTRPVLTCLAVVAAGLFALAHLQVHYAAPAAGILVLLSTSGLRRFWLWARRASRRGEGRAWLCVVPALWMIVLSYGAVSVAERIRASAEIPPRSRVVNRLAGEPGRHLVLVRYSEQRASYDEWVYNDADLASAAILWARDMGPDRNQGLLRAFPGRQVWCIEPDRDPGGLSPCSP